LSLAAERSKVRGTYHLDRSRYFLPTPGRTFHGRDVFAPIVGRLLGGMTPQALGTPVEDHLRLQLPVPRRTDSTVEGQVIHIDRFGNLVCNIERADLGAFREEILSVTIGGVQIAGISTHYAAVREGKPVALWNSWDLLEIAVRNDSAARHLRSRTGDRVKVQGSGR
jgi:S-adenosyl-L-methionine hydrolase (adenosine-forming)